MAGACAVLVLVVVVVVAGVCAASEGGASEREAAFDGCAGLGPCSS